MDIQSPKEWVIEPSAGRCPAAGGPTRAFGAGRGGIPPAPHAAAAEVF